jgi:hypothetical protein
MRKEKQKQKNIAVEGEADVEMQGRVEASRLRRGRPDRGAQLKEVRPIGEQIVGAERAEVARARLAGRRVLVVGRCRGCVVLVVVARRRRRRPVFADGFSSVDREELRECDALDGVAPQVGRGKLPIGGRRSGAERAVVVGR